MKDMSWIPLGLCRWWAIERGSNRRKRLEPGTKIKALKFIKGFAIQS
jgi:hypothetical protein